MIRRLVLLAMIGLGVPCSAGAQGTKLWSGVSIEGARGPWGDTRRLDGAIEGAMELGELLEVHSIAWLV